MFFDEFLSEPENQNLQNVDVKDLVGLLDKYPGSIVWIAMRPDSSQFEAPVEGFEVVELKKNFRNSPKIYQGVKHFFEELELKSGNILYGKFGGVDTMSGYVRYIPVVSSNFR